MKDTMFAEKGFELNVKNDTIVVYDGEYVIGKYQARSYDDFLDEVVEGANECARVLDYFSTESIEDKTLTINQWAIWVDCETFEFFISSVYTYSHKII